jgi:hypothetical protein
MNSAAFNMKNKGERLNNLTANGNYHAVKKKETVGRFGDERQ